MSVLDLLSHTVSGVYFMYHHDVEKWSMGKLSALREVAMAGEARYEYYYMGYYIHNCDKMRYKSAYRPQHVLDYETYQWSPLDQLRSLFDSRRYVSKTLAEQHTANTDISTLNGSTTDLVMTGASSSDSTSYWEYDSPLEAAESGSSLLDIRMPGVMTLEQVKSQIDLDNLSISIRRAQGVRTSVSPHS